MIASYFDIWLTPCIVSIDMSDPQIETPTERRFCLCLPGQLKWGTRAAVLNEARWPIGSVVTVKFLEGDLKLRQRVREVAKKWLKITSNIEFVFVDAGPAEIRIAFQQGNGSWSYLGRACQEVADEEPTMNFGWLAPESSDLEVQRVVLHEFGHALGLIHEHQNPKGGIRWRHDVVRAELSGFPNYWSDEIIEVNMFAQSAMSDVTATQIDPKSIMMYMIPGTWTEDGFSADQNDDLSPQDIELVRSIYGQ